jgi:hypothetical protein
MDLDASDELFHTFFTLSQIFINIDLQNYRAARARANQG